MVVFNTTLCRSLSLYLKSIKIANNKRYQFMELETMKTRVKTQRPNYKWDTGYMMLHFSGYKVLLYIPTPSDLTTSWKVDIILPISQKRTQSLGGEWLMLSGKDRQEPHRLGLEDLGCAEFSGKPLKVQAAEC